MTDETERDREQRARDIAVATALRAQEVNGRLTSAEQRLDRINGSIDRAANESRELRLAHAALSDRLERFMTEQATNAAVASARQEEIAKAAAKQASEIAKANDQQISRRDFALGVITIMVMLLGVLISGAHL